MQTVSIIGVGLLGGSFARALRARGYTGALVGVSSPGTIEKALAAGVIDEGATLQEAVERADLIYLSQPILAIIETMKQIGPWLRPDALVTDVGSTKRAILRAAVDYLPRDRFIGGHPMAGKEKTGVEHSDANLFCGRSYFLAPLGAVEETETAAQFRDWIHRFGAETTVVTAEEHDRIVAVTSHLPQLLSTCLGGVVGRLLPEQKAIAGTGPGLEDMLRLAASAYPLWADILETNWDFIQAALQEYSRELSTVIAAGANGRLEKPFERAGEISRKIRHKQS